MSRTDSHLDRDLASLLAQSLARLPQPAQPLDPDALAARLAEEPECSDAPAP